MGGLFITFEGSEGSGKTTQVGLLGEWLSLREPVVVREPGGTELGERIRELVLYESLEIDAEAEMYLFMSARKQLVTEVIAPALDEGQIVIADRYHDSTVAYQGGGRGVATSWPVAFPVPNITFLLQGPVRNGLLRHEAAGKTRDRLEMEDIEFHERVATEYERLAEAEPTRFVRIDATLSRERVHLDIRRHLQPLLEAMR